MNRGKHARTPSVAERRKRTLTAGLVAAAAALAICGVVVGVLFALPPAPLSYSESVETPSEAVPPSDEPTAETETEAYAGPPATPAVPPTTADVAALPNTPELFTFCTADPAAAPQLTEPMARAIAQATAPLAAQGDTVGYLFMDLADGAGVAANIDATYYSASTIKGPFAVFLCQTVIDDASASDSSAATSPSTGGGMNPDQLKLLVEDTIRFSSNEAYRTLRSIYTRQGFAEWLSARGVDPSRYTPVWYPDYSVREAAQLWLATDQYLATATPTAQWLQTLFTETETSFIRRGLEGENVAIENKAGWITAYPADALNDCGLIRADNTTYLMCLLSDGPEGEPTEGAISSLAKALFDTRTAFPTAEMTEPAPETDPGVDPPEGA